MNDTQKSLERTVGKINHEPGQSNHPQNEKAGNQDRDAKTDAESRVSKDKEKVDGKSVSDKSATKKKRKMKIKGRERKKVKHRSRFFILKAKPDRKAARGRIPVGKKTGDKSVEEAIPSPLRKSPLQAVQWGTGKESEKTVKRLVGDAKSLAEEEKPSAEAEEAPEQYAIEQIEGKAKKVGKIALDETKKAVEKSLKKEKQLVAEAVSGDSTQESRHVSEEPDLQLHEEKGPEVYEEGLQNDVDKETRPSVIKEHGVQTRGEGEGEAEPSPGLVQPAPTLQESSFPVPHSSGGPVHKLEEHPSAAYSQNIAAVSPAIHRLEGREQDSGQGMAAAPQQEPDSAVTVNGQEVQTADRAVQSELYPEPQQSAYQFYPAIQAQQEAIPSHDAPSGEFSGRSANPLTENWEVRPGETANQPGVSASQRESQFGQAPAQKAAAFGSQYKSYSSSGSPSSNVSGSGRKVSKNSNGADNSAPGAPLRGQAPARAEGKAGIKTREVSNEIHASGKVSLNTWQRDFMVNQLNNQTPALATVSTQGSAAVQAVANYGQAAVLQAGGGMATAATGAATGGVGFAVQAGKVAAEKAAEQIKSAIRSAAMNVRESKQTWGAMAAVLFFPIMLVMAISCIFRISGSATNVGLSADVLALMPQINAACAEHGIPEYAPLVAAVVMQESGGNVELVHGDVMQCAEGMGYPVGTPISVEESIDFGTGLLADLLHQAGASGPADISKISLALQSYNFGGGYLNWAVSKYGGYSRENALEYSQQQAAAMGWSGYGDPEYVDHVLRYYQVTSGSMGDRSAIANGLFAYPMPGHTWHTYAGHEGIDIAYDGILGQPIYACAAGTVSYVQNSWSASMGTNGMASYGNCVFIDHGNGWESRYAHMTTAVVASGTFVQEGQLIGYVGSTGNSTGPHLHLALYYNSSPSSGGVIYAEQAWPQLKG